ncbi:MAG: hypothetical protein COS76_00760 [Candidatus Portnoybacteria bacterium CG06_land_8_20_14_3_00_39_12]|uniref:tRNA dimethylallyltransferase n=2 Tax=Candidatus Portnoyibacteriota TaxID=1817913 RepID=A0A2M7AXV3_9BACT|nr:MAG: hypothetical protein COS76_00760 [Candidatus Portnoybacteria bacterium CG06_land_8_20_14_3_00_39_12]
MQKNLPKIIVILGPTASGKSSWGLRLAKKFSGYIISADSRQIYRQMDIGTAKNLPLQQNNLERKVDQEIATSSASASLRLSPRDDIHIPHFMMDIVNPNDDYNVAQYQAKVKRIIKSRQPQIPFLVGGTGLYIQAIVDNLIIPEVPPDVKIRTKLELQTNEQLFSRLKKLDPICAKKIDAKNRRRLIRALEVCLKTDLPFSQLRQKDKPLFNTLQIGISVPKKELERKIDSRVNDMIKQGLIEEVKILKKQYLDCHSHESRRYPVRYGNPRLKSTISTMDPRICGDNNSNKTTLKLPAFSGIGYQEIIQYLQNKISLEQAIKLIKQHTKQYAKRQMTWFKRDPRIHWVTKYAEVEKLVKDFLEK